MLHKNGSYGTFELLIKSAGRERTLWRDHPTMLRELDWPQPNGLSQPLFLLESLLLLN